MSSPETGSVLIGLTGGIASGKSTVLQHLRQSGYSVIDADKLGHKVLEKGNPGYNKVVKYFGNEILNSDNTVNRTALGRIVFGDPVKLKQLNQISHPIIAEMIQREFKEIVSSSNIGIVFLEAALLIETNWHKFCGQTWVVLLDSEVAAKRLQLRDGLNKKEAETRIKIQITPEARISEADVIIRNDKTTEDLISQTEQALKNLKYSRAKFIKEK